PLSQLVIFTPGYIEANHTSPDGPEGENIEISLSSTALTHGCRATVRIHALVNHLVSSPGFVEMTNEWACLGYGLAACRA
uniref:Uncharacterized protein n=1 Tax=Cyclopterus lumpus TaxID=8103 RepID=A0A8C2ZG70_CYCLU